MLPGMASLFIDLANALFTLAIEILTGIALGVIGAGPMPPPYV